jgi:hypothetical protein
MMAFYPVERGDNHKSKQWCHGNCYDLVQYVLKQMIDLITQPGAVESRFHDKKWNDQPQQHVILING